MQDELIDQWINLRSRPQNLIFLEELMVNFLIINSSFL